MSHRILPPSALHIIFFPSLCEPPRETRASRKIEKRFLPRFPEVAAAIDESKKRPEVRDTLDFPPIRFSLSSGRKYDENAIPTGDRGKTNSAEDERRFIRERLHKILFFSEKFVTRSTTRARPILC